jgi:hypothetical protein
MGEEFRTWLCTFNPRRQLTELISFRGDRSVALSIDSSYPDVFDCYEIQLDDDERGFGLGRQEKLAPRDTKNFALAVWQEREMLVLLNERGKNFCLNNLTVDRATLVNNYGS